MHAGPDIVDRIGDDGQIGHAYELADFSGFVLKAHYESTVGRAHALTQDTGQTVYGGIALNQHTGGINASAVAAALSSGEESCGCPPRMPTPSKRRVCRGCAITNRDFPLTPMPYRRWTRGPRRRPTSSWLWIADHDAVLATGHLSGEECHWLRERAKHFGISRMLFTHPSYTVPGLTASQVEDLVDAGGHAEITTYQLLHQPGCTPAMLADVARAAGDKLILSSDVGQPNSPPPPEALLLLLDTLAGEGLDRLWLEAAASTTPASLFAPA
ncbi:MAG: DUF6282 family protein [Nocardioidaceae bacterium]